jgi:hypothetical protein
MSPLRSDAIGPLLRAIRIKTGGHPVMRVEEACSRSWASVTFVGARHELTLVLHGNEALAKADTFLAGLEATEFHLDGHILADIALVSREDMKGAGDQPEVRLKLEALTVEDA